MSCGSLSPAPSLAFQPKPSTSSGQADKQNEVPCGVFVRSVRFSAPEQKPARLSISRDSSGSSRNSAGPGPIPIPASSMPQNDTPMSRSAPASLPAVSLDPPGTPCRFPKLEECAHFHYERVALGGLMLSRVSDGDEDFSEEEIDEGWVTIRVQTHVNATSTDESVLDASLTSCNVMTGHITSATCSDGWLLTRNANNFMMMDEMLHRCIYDRKVSGLPVLSSLLNKNLVTDRSTYLSLIEDYIHHLSIIADDTINCASILNWLHADNKGHRLLVPDEDSSSINTPAVAAAYSVRKYVSQARDEISFEVGDMISVIDMPGPEESMWWRGKRGFNVGFFPQSCVAVIGDKVPRNMSQPPPIVGSVAVTQIKPVLRKHGKLISLFRSFILSRPSRRVLKLQGILKERVFGCDLGEHLANTGQDVPLVLSCCAELLESEPAPDGVYRLSGGATLVQRLRTAFDDVSVTSTNILDDPTVRADRHAVASLLKLYFRELPNPLCTYQLYSEFVSSVRAATPQERLMRMRRTVLKLPPPHYRTLAYLMRHLKNMSGQCDKTSMCGRNLAIVWAPNLLRTPNLLRAPADKLDLAGLAVQAVVTEYLIVFAEEIFSENSDVDFLEPDSSNDEVELRSSTRTRPKTLMLSRSPTKLLSLEEARNRSIKAASISANLLPASISTELSSKSSQRYIEVGSGPNNLPQYHTVINLPNGGPKRALKRSPSSVWKTIFSRSTHKDMASTKTRPSIQLLLNQVEEQPKPEDAICSKEINPLRPVKSCESLGSEKNDSVPSLPPTFTQNTLKQHTRSSSCDSYFEPWQVELAGMRLRLSPQERDGNIFSEEDDTNKQCLSAGSSPETTDPLKSVEPSPSRPDSSLRKRSKLEEQLQYIDAESPRHAPAQHLDAKRVRKDREGQNKSNESSPTHVKLRERTSPRKPKSSRYSNTHLQPNSDAKIFTILKKNDNDRLTWHGLDDNHSTLIKIDWPSEADSLDVNLTPITPTYNRLESETESSDNKQTIKVPEDLSHDYENVTDKNDTSSSIHYQNMSLLSGNTSDNLKTMSSSHDSSTLSNVSPLKTTDELYECMDFKRPNYINLSSCTSKSTLSSPLKSPLRSTISITFKSPTKISKNDDSDYENVDLSPKDFYENVDKASLPDIDPNLPTQDATQSDKNDQDDLIDIYSQVKFFKQTIDEVNAIIKDDEPKPIYENVNFDLARINLEPNDLLALEEPKTCIDRRVLKPKVDNLKVLKPLNTTVKQLAEKFESPTEPNAPLSFEKFKFSTLERRKQVNCEKNRENIAKTDEQSIKTDNDLSKFSSSTRSLDENSFVKDGSIIDRRKSFEVKNRIMPDFNLYLDKTNTANEDMHNKISLVQARLTDTEPKSIITLINDKKMSRERIEKYKEERRNLLREKYGSHSFRQTDLKLSKKDENDVKVSENPVECNVIELRKSNTDIQAFGRRNTFDLGQRIKFKQSLECSRTGHDDSRIVECSRSDEENRTSLPSSSLQQNLKETSPLLNIKDMAAMFEQKSSRT